MSFAAPLPVVRLILDSNPVSSYTPRNPSASAASHAVKRLAEQLALSSLTGRFSYIYDYRERDLFFVSKGIEHVLGGLPPTEAQTLDWLYDRVHPDDAAQVAQASVLVNTYIRHCSANDDFSRFVMAIDYRLRHVAGHYVRVLRQNLILERDRTGAVITTAAIYTDISNHKLTQEVRLHVNRADFAAFAHQATQPPFSHNLSPREQQVASLVLQGFSSVRIAKELGASVYTINTHRRNLRRKLASTSYYTLLQELPPLENE